MNIIFIFICVVDDQVFEKENEVLFRFLSLIKRYLLNKTKEYAMDTA